MCWQLGLLIFGPPAFILGFIAGRFSETHKETIVTVRTKAREGREVVRAWFDRWAPLLYIVIAVLAFSGVAQGVSNANQNARDLVTQCKNGNESRAANRALWGYILDVSTANNPHPTGREQEFYGDFRRYINAVYQPHDCTDLSKSYKLPDAPDVINTRHESRDGHVR